MEFMLDLGAYSAWTKGVTINIDEYCEFIKKHSDIINHYIVLDVIGDAEKSLEAQKYMESKGLRPLPVFHQGEDWKYLDYYANNYDYICISPLSYSAGGSSMVNWLDKCFSDHVCDKDGYPKCKVHGLGLTTVKMMLRYPWYSVDSSSWVQTSAYGGIMVPRIKNGEWDWSVSPTIIGVSNRRKSIESDVTNYFNLSDSQKSVVDKYFKEYGILIGSSEFDENDKETVIVKGVSNTYQMRDQVNAMFYRELEKHFKPYPWIFKPKSTGGFFI